MSTKITQLSPFTPDGTCMGQSPADLISFYGYTPIAQRSGAAQAAVTTTAAVFSTTPLSSAPFGFSSLAAAQGLVATVNALVADMAAINTLATKLRADLVAYGLLKGSA